MHDVTDRPPPYIVTSATDAAAVLTNARVARSMTGEALDAHAGLPDRYTAKLERPHSSYGRQGLWISNMWELWADALGYVLVLMPKEQAQEIGAQVAPARHEFPAGGGSGIRRHA